ncbi:MAG: hypothetical protein V7765_07755 [Oleispira sp.]
MRTANSFTLLLLTIFGLTAYADLSTNDKARNAIALGRVTYQCGQNSTPTVAVPPALPIDLAYEASGLVFADVLKVLKTGNSQELVQQRVDQLKADIKAGRKTCADLLSLATTNSYETARYWIAVGSVAHQCGIEHQPRIHSTIEDTIHAASRNTGLPKSQIINILNNPFHKRLIESKILELKEDIRDGYISCADTILGMSASYMK